MKAVSLLATNQQYLTSAAKVLSGDFDSEDLSRVQTMAGNPRQGANGATVQTCQDALAALAKKSK